MPDELWMEVHDIVQEIGIKTIPMEKKYKKAKWLSGEALQIAVKRREVKSKGEKERYKHLNTEFHGIAKRDKKDFQFTLIHGPNIRGSYEILLFTASDLASTTRHINNWVLFLLWLHP